MRSSSRWFVSSLVGLALTASAWAGAPTAPETFPPDFTWGTVLSAHSVEGGHQANNWAAWEAAPGHVPGNAISGPAVNHWELYREDIRWMKELGQKAVIVSLEWSRIEPNPKQYDQAAIDHYRDVFKQLRAQGIEPIVVLWDRTLPTWVTAYTGLEVPGVILDFCDFAGQAAKQFGDLVDVWVPVRDPVGAASKAYKTGVNPPGKTDVAAFSKAVITLLAMHRGAREALRAGDTTAAGGKAACQVGLIASMRCIRPNRADHPMDQNLVKTSEYFSRAFVEAIMKGDLTMSAVPTETGKGGFGKMQTYSPPQPPTYDKRLADFLAIQYEGLEELKFNPLFPLFTQKIIPPGAVRDGAGQISFAEGLTQVLSSLKKYPVPLMVIISAFDAKGFDRVAHLREHAAATLKAIGNGAQVKGLFYDSLLSGFEYEYGYSLRKGLLRVNRKVQERKPTMVAKAFARLATGGALHAPTGDGDDNAAEPEGESTSVPAQPGESAAADPSAPPPASSNTANDHAVPAQPGESIDAEPSAQPTMVPGGADQPPKPAPSADRVKAATANQTKAPAKGYLKVTDSKKGKTRATPKTTKDSSNSGSKSDARKSATGTKDTAQPASEHPATPPDSPELPAIDDAGRVEM